MSGGVCVKMNGSQCAMQYCDYWDSDEQMCAAALEAHRRAELLGMILAKARELLEDVEDKEKLMQVVKELNIIDPVSTIQ
jgi:hypothetical protein